MMRKQSRRPPGRAVYDHQVDEYRHRITLWLRSGMPVDVFDGDHRLIQRWYPFPDIPAYEIVRAQNRRMGYFDGDTDSFRYGTRLDEYFIVAHFVKLSPVQRLSYRLDRYVEGFTGWQALRRLLVFQYRQQQACDFESSPLDHHASNYAPTE